MAVTNEKKVLQIVFTECNIYYALQRNTFLEWKRNLL